MYWVLTSVVLRTVHMKLYCRSVTNLHSL